MPVYLFTYHAYQTWLPDRPQGYVKRRKGILPQDIDEAERYRNNSNENEFSFTGDVQRLLIETMLTACKFQKLRPHCIASETTHVHALVSWTTAKKWERVRDGLKTSMTKALRAKKIEREKFFSAGSSRRQVRGLEHFEYLMNKYLPDHHGWKWRDGDGMFK